MRVSSLSQPATFSSLRTVGAKDEFWKFYNPSQGSNLQPVAEPPQATETFLKKLARFFGFSTKTDNNLSLVALETEKTRNKNPIQNFETPHTFLATKVAQMLGFTAPGLNQFSDGKYPVFIGYYYHATEPKVIVAVHPEDSLSERNVASAFNNQDNYFKILKNLKTQSGLVVTSDSPYVQAENFNNLARTHTVNTL